MLQKQPSQGVLKERCSGNMHQIYRIIPSNFIETTLRRGCTSVNLLHIFRTPFHKNASGGLFLMIKATIFFFQYETTEQLF